MAYYYLLAHRRQGFRGSSGVTTEDTRRGSLKMVGSPLFFQDKYHFLSYNSRDLCFYCTYSIRHSTNLYQSFLLIPISQTTCGLLLLHIAFFSSRIADCVPQNGYAGGVVLVVVITISLVFPDWPQLCRCSPHRTLLRAGFSVRALYHVIIF